MADILPRKAFCFATDVLVRRGGLTRVSRWSGCCVIGIIMVIFVILWVNVFLTVVQALEFANHWLQRFGRVSSRFSGVAGPRRCDAAWLWLPIYKMAIHRALANVLSFLVGQITNQISIKSCHGHWLSYRRGSARVSRLTPENLSAHYLIFSSATSTNQYGRICSQFATQKMHQLEKTRDNGFPCVWLPWRTGSN